MFAKIFELCYFDHDFNQIQTIVIPKKIFYWYNDDIIHEVGLNAF